MRNLALADLTDDDLRAMLAENETLFVEHKTAVGGEGYQVAKAICSFANTLGGWVLIGVTNGEPNAGTDNGWTPVAPHELTDRVREALAINRVDPIPAFAAAVHDNGDLRKPVGVVRVYESADTPHVMSNGQVFVRSVAQDADQRRVYRAGGVETQAVLISLADRGRDAVERARRQLDPNHVPVAARGLGLLHSSGAAWAMQDARVGVWAVPVTNERMADWAVSKRAATALATAVRQLAGDDDDHPVDQPKPHALGIEVTARSASFRSGSSSRRAWLSVASDAGGVIAASVSFGVQQPPLAKSRTTLAGLREELFTPLLKAIVTMLEEAELHGRILLDLRIGRLEEVIELDDDGGFRNVPHNLSFAGELSLPLGEKTAEMHALAEQWRADVGRSAGYMTLRP